ncbi:hypothetical protein [Fundidesulfovibrio terrae]|uniref:hypothetical protein n=1 Tax=Fundidesulfovibrio terrae TaxID=2922866 RepID=UPI001FAECEC2|nr:hypothetical protein [Fundidesulfovibrio terrae]
MSRMTAILAGLFVLACLSPAHAASQKALDLRKADGLSEFSPPEAFLSGGFLADEMEPCYLFGSVKEFVASRKCPTTWLIEEGEKARIAKPASPDAPLEYTLYLEEDCPDGVVHYVFVDQSAMTPKQWIEWRKQFHKSKAEGEYGATKDRLEKAVSEGMKISGELRFIMKNGELSGNRTPEQTLRQDMNFPACYDLKQGAKLPK